MLQHLGPFVDLMSVSLPRAKYIGQDKNNPNKQRSIGIIHWNTEQNRITLPAELGVMALASHFLAMYKIKVCLLRPKWGHLLLHVTLVLSNCSLPLKEEIQHICLHLASGFFSLLCTGSMACAGTGGGYLSPWTRLILFLWVTTCLHHWSVLTNPL